MVVAGGQQVAVQVGVPREAVTLFLVAAKAQVRHADTVGIGLGGVLGVVEDENVAGRGLGGNDARVLRHASRAVDLSLVVDLDLDLDFAGHRSETAELALLVVVVRRVELRVLVGKLSWKREAGKQKYELKKAIFRHISWTSSIQFMGSNKLTFTSGSEFVAPLN